MERSAIYADMVKRLLESPATTAVKPPRGMAWPLAHGEPEDAAALYEQCDGLTLASGVSLFGRGELRDVTDWLVLEKGLSWPSDLVVVGERRDTVLVLDLDVAGVRAGGGVLEVANDDLGMFDRVASGLLAYLLVHAGAGHDPAPPPEVTAAAAAAAGDAARLESELARPLYPGSERIVASLANTLGALFAARNETERALAAFERSVTARTAQARRGAQVAERRAAWRAAALACRARGLESVATLCDARATSDESRAQ